MTPTDPTLQAAEEYLWVAKRLKNMLAYRALIPKDGEHHFDVVVEWAWGSHSNPDGYRAIQSYVRGVTEARMRQMVDEAIDACTRDVEAARLKLRGAI